jgi:hypothetical protein
MIFLCGAATTNFTFSFHAYFDYNHLEYLYIYKASTYLPLIVSKQEMSLFSPSQVAVHSVFVVLFGYLLHGRNRHRQHLPTPSQHKTAANSNANLSENRHSLN